MVSRVERLLQNQKRIEQMYGILPARLQEMPPNMAEVALLSVDEVGRLLGASRKVIDQHIHKGDLVGVLLGRTRKFRLSDIREFLERQAVSPKVVPLAAARKRRAPMPPPCLNSASSAELDRLLMRRGR